MERTEFGEIDIEFSQVGQDKENPTALVNVGLENGAVLEIEADLEYIYQLAGAANRAYELMRWYVADYISVRNLFYSGIYHITEKGNQQRGKVSSKTLCGRKPDSSDGYWSGSYCIVKKLPSASGYCKKCFASYNERVGQSR